MKRLFRVIIALGLLVASISTTSIAENNTVILLETVEGCHRIAGIPFGTNMQRFVELINTEYGLSADIIEAQEDKAAYIKIKDTNAATVFGKPISSASFQFYESYTVEVDGKQVTRYLTDSPDQMRSAYISFETPQNQSAEAAVAYMKSIFDTATDTIGEYSFASLACTSKDGNRYDYEAPIRQGILDIDTLLLAMEDSVSVTFYAVFDNLSIGMFTLVNRAFFICSFTDTIREQDVVQTKGYYGVSQTSSSGAEFTYRNGIQMGMSMDEVRALEADKEIGADDNTLLYSGVKVAGNDASLMYVFDTTTYKLVTIFVLFEDKHSNFNDYIDDFSKVDKALIAKYGEGTTNSLYRWKDDLFKDDESQHGLAIAAGQMTIGSLWDINQIEIAHLLTGDNYEISHVLRYRLADYIEPTNIDGI